MTTSRVVRSFSAAIGSSSVATFRADWTSRDPAITEAIARLGRSGVPVYALYPGGGAAPVLLPELLTPALVLDALEGVAPVATASRAP